MGYCAGYDAAGYAQPGFGGYGFGRGWSAGRGMGRRHRCFAPPPPGWGYASYTAPTKEETLAGFKADADWLRTQLEEINKRIEELEE